MTPSEELRWIHDCVLLETVFDASVASVRSLRVKIRCPTNLGYPRWAGRIIAINFADVAVFSHVGWGISSGYDSFDRFRPQISKELQDRTLEARHMGIRFPDIEFSMLLHSGSILEGICGLISIEINP